MAFSVATALPDLDPAEIVENPVQPRRLDIRRDRERHLYKTSVRYLTVEGFEFEGVLRDIAPVGLRIDALDPPMLGSKIVLYIHKIGRFTGVVVRSEEASFALRVEMSDKELAQLERSLTAFVGSHKTECNVSSRRLAVSDRRANDRHTDDCHAVNINRVDCATLHGEFSCEIETISHYGAAIITGAKLQLGQEVMIGKVKGVVTRATDNGYAITSARAL